MCNSFLNHLVSGEDMISLPLDTSVCTPIKLEIILRNYTTIVNTRKLIFELTTYLICRPYSGFAICPNNIL